jgi:hypothetical protein
MRRALTRIHAAVPRISLLSSRPNHIGFTELRPAAKLATPVGLQKRAAGALYSRPKSPSSGTHTGETSMSSDGTLLRFQIFCRPHRNGVSPAHLNALAIFICERHDALAATIAFRASPMDIACVLPRRAIRGVLRQGRFYSGEGLPGGDIFLDLPSRNSQSVRLDPKPVNSRNATVVKVVVRCSVALVDGLLNGIR